MFIHLYQINKENRNTGLQQNVKILGPHVGKIAISTRMQFSVFCLFCMHLIFNKYAYAPKLVHVNNQTKPVYQVHKLSLYA
jgi:hypothetical protein